MTASALLAVTAGCTPDQYARQADDVVGRIIRQKQSEALGKSEPFTIDRSADTLRRRLLLAQDLPYSSGASFGTDRLERIKYWPVKEDRDRANMSDNAPGPSNNPGGPLRLTLIDALQVAARNNREYQSRKEDIFRASLDMDLERDAFANTFFGSADSLYSSDLGGDGIVGGLENSGQARWTRKLKSGAALSGRIVMDLVKLLTLDRASSLGIFADTTVSIPLLRGSGRHIVAEPLTQAQRDVVYSIYTFERFKRTMAVRIASEYLDVLQQSDRVDNTEGNYRSLIAATRRARRLADAGRLPEIQVDQAKQDQLRARERWIVALQTYARRLDQFKITMGLPADANVELDKGELERLAETARKSMANGSTTAPADTQPTTSQATPADSPIRIDPPSGKDGGPFEMKPSKAAKVALEHRLDLRTAEGRVYDAQRGVVIAADALGAELTLAGTAQAGARRSISSAGQPDAQLRPERGLYTGAVLLDLPLERTAERNAYRSSFITLEQTVRSVQELEDEIKLGVRNALRNLLQARESYMIQAKSAELAMRRVISTKLFLQAGMAQIRDVLEAEEALILAQNALTAALVDYRVAELELQRDMGVLKINEKGLWREYEPG